MAYKGKTIENSKTGQTIRFIKTGAETKGELLVMQVFYQPFSIEPPLHYHPFQTEVFEVMAGEMNVTINGVSRIILAGEQFEIPANTAHAMWNGSAQAAVVSWEVRPAMRTAAFLETVTALSATQNTNKKDKPVLLQAVAVATEFSKEFRLAKPAWPVQRIVFGLLKPLARWRGYYGIHRMPD
jgi:quercetin dioxygenase-like cupin family protein